MLPARLQVQTEVPPEGPTIDDRILREVIHQKIPKPWELQQDSI